MIYIVLIASLISILWHLFIHIMVMFSSEVRDKAVEHVLKDPRKYVGDEHACYFIRNMFALLVVLMLLVAAFRGNIKISEKSTEVEIGNVKKL